MGNAYLEMKNRHQGEVNDFPLMFAFSKEQFEEGMRNLGLEPTDYDKVYRLGDTGGYYRRTDAPALRDMLERHEREMQQAIAADRTGDGFIFDMFSYELANHEYGYTLDVSDTLDALGLTAEEVNADERLLNGLQKAMAQDELAESVRGGSDFIQEDSEKPLDDVVKEAKERATEKNQAQLENNNDNRKPPGHER